VIDKGHRAVLDAVNRLAANTQTLEAAVRSSAEIVATMEHSAAQQPSNALTELRGTVEELTAVIRDLKLAPPQVRPADDSAAGLQQPIDGLAELRGAVEELTAVIRGLDLAPSGGGAVTRDETPSPQLAREIRELLQEIEGAR
jgi:hypothetical protein